MNHRKAMPIATPDQLRECLRQKHSMTAQAIRLLELLDRREISARFQGDTQLMDQLEQERRFILRRL
jgi:hypothetical protein